MHVIVVGAGLGGMTLAHALACKGHTVDLVERHVQLRPELGAAIAVSGGLAVLRSLGLEEELDQFVTPVQWLEQWLAEGMKPLSHITTKPEPAQLPPLGGKAVVLTNDGPSATGFAFARRGDLHSMLHRTLPLNVSLLLGSTVKSVNASSPLGPATVTLQDGAVLRGDVIVGADGIHSNVRKCILGENQGRVYTGIAGVYAIASKEAVLGKGSLHGSGLSADEAALLASLPVGCAREFQGNGCLGMIFHLKDDLSFVFMEQTPDPPTSDETWDHPGVRESIFASIEKHHMPSLFLKIIPHAQVAHLGLYEAEICPSWHKGRAVLLGDAAHATTPFLGQGANQAILDAYSLARHLPAAEDGTVDPAAIERAFTSYFRARAPHARAIVRASRMFGTLRLGATPLMRCARRVVLCAMGCFRGALFARFIGWATRPQV